MLRSSTSSSDRATRRRVLLAALAVVLLAELVFRLPGVTSVIGRPDLYYSPGVNERLEAVAEVEAEHGPVDVLFVGSSVVRTNIRPYAFDRVLAEAGSEVVSFNGGLSDLRPDAARLYLDRLWLDRVAPRVVFQAVRYGELINPMTVEDFDRFDGSRYEELWMSESPLVPVQLFLLDNVRLAQYAGVLTDALAAPETVIELGFHIDGRGWNATEDRLPDLRTRYAVSEIPGGGAAANGYSSPIDDAVFVDGLAILAETIATVRASGADYVLINMPEHGDKFLRAPDGANRYRHYVDLLRAFAAEHGVPFIDITQGDPGMYDGDEPFSDFHHMTPEGAAEFTRLLAEATAERGVLSLVETSGP